MLRAIRAMLYCLLQHYVQQQVTFLYSTANLGHFSPVLSMTPSLHLPSPLHCGNHCTTTLMNVSCEFYDRRAYLLICAFVSYVEPHFSSFYLLCRIHDNTALTPQPYVVHFFAFVHFALLCVCSHCLCVLLICIPGILWYVITSSLHYKIRLCSSTTYVTPGISHRPHLVARALGVQSCTSARGGIPST